MDACCELTKAEAVNAFVPISLKTSPLAGKMFMSYLKKNITSDIIDEIVKAVKVHPTHTAIVDWVQRKVQGFVDQMDQFPCEGDLRRLCSDAIDSFRMLAPGPAMAEAPSCVAGKAYFSGNLQAVIGGINDIILSDSRIISKDSSRMDFNGTYIIRDYYDFDNDRSMFPTYDKYRKDLASLYASSCTSFMTRFHKDMINAPASGGNAKTGPLDMPQIFTCFMYAIEVNRCTESLYWMAEIPFTATVIHRQPSSLAKGVVTGHTPGPLGIQSK